MHGSSKRGHARERAGTAQVNAPRRCQRSESERRSVELVRLDAGEERRHGGRCGGSRRLGNENPSGCSDGSGCAAGNARRTVRVASSWPWSVAVMFMSAGGIMPVAIGVICADASGDRCDALDRNRQCQEQGDEKAKNSRQHRGEL